MKPDFLEMAHAQALEPGQATHHSMALDLRDARADNERMRAALKRAEDLACRLFGTDPIDREQVAVELDDAVRAGLYPESTLDRSKADGM